MLARSMRFLARYLLWYDLLAAAFGAVVLAGWYLTGYELFGTYTQLLLVLLPVFTGAAGFMAETYLNIALAMGATRRANALAVQLLLPFNTVLLLGLAVAVQRAAAQAGTYQAYFIGEAFLPGTLGLVGLVGWLAGQVCLLAVRIPHPGWRTAACLLAEVVVCAANALVLVRQQLPWPGLRWDMPLGAALALLAAAAGGLYTVRYQKAVVRV